MDVQLAIKILDEWIDKTDAYFRAWNSGEEVEKLDDWFAGRLPLMQALKKEVDPEGGAAFGKFGSTRGPYWVWTRETAVRLKGILAEMGLREALLGPRGPQLVAAKMHPLIWNAAAALWDDGHHRQAVQTAAAALEAALQKLLGKPDVGGTDLAQAFSVRDPDANWPRLRFRQVDANAERTWTSAHEGASYLVRGAFQFVRNLTSHAGVDSEDVEYLEQLAVLSTVARIVDRCEVVRGQNQP